MSVITRSRFALFAGAVIIGALATFPTRSFADQTVKGTVVIARTHPTALLIWDASPAVGDLVIAQQTGTAGMRGLEADAIDVLAAHAPRLRANRLEIHAAYRPTGIVGAAYNASTFANTTPLVVVTCDRRGVLAHVAAWKADLLRGVTPAGVTVRTTGAFPAAQ